jgi:hypothetical protein
MMDYYPIPLSNVPETGGEDGVAGPGLSRNARIAMDGPFQTSPAAKA